MSNHKLITPDNWQEGWSDEAVTFLKPLINKIQFAFMERDYDAALQLWQPGYNPKGSFVSLGIRRQGQQENGNGFSLLYAFGFFYEAAYRWDAEVPGWIDHMADRAIEEYSAFYDEDKWPIDNVHLDDEVLKRNANISAPVARRTNAHTDQPKVKALKPTQMPELNCDVKKLNDAMTDVWGEPIKNDPWDFEEEEDPLS